MNQYCVSNGGCNSNVRFGVHVPGYTEARSLPSSARSLLLCCRISVQAVVLCKIHVLPEEIACQMPLHSWTFSLLTDMKSISSVFTPAGV